MNELNFVRAFFVALAPKNALFFFLSLLFIYMHFSCAPLPWCYETHTIAIARDPRSTLALGRPNREMLAALARWAMLLEI